MTLLLLITTPPALAQRYLTEFVGKANVATATGSVAVDTNLAFDTSSGNHFAGDFLLDQTDAFGNVETQFYSVDAVAVSGRCPARLSGDASGHLRLTEYSFDANSFALVGEVNIEEDTGSVILTSGRMQGPVGMITPPADTVALHAAKGLLSVDGSAGSEDLDVVLGDLDELGTARGVATDARGEVVWELMFTSSEKWFYVLGVGSASTLVGRGAVVLAEDGSASYAEGDFEELSSSGKAIDSGSFVVDLR